MYVSCIRRGCGEVFRTKPYIVESGRGLFCSRACRYLHARDPIVIKERFWGYVDIGKKRECWPWNGFLNEDGYGVFYFMYNTKRIKIHSHRFSWKITFGKIIDRLHVLHKCDNPPCCNPYHLFLGTHQDNMRDRDRKGRQNHPFGDENGNSKLTVSDVLEIRRLDSIGYKQSEIRKIYHWVGSTQIHAIVHRTSWGHIP